MNILIFYSVSANIPSSYIKNKLISIKVLIQYKTCLNSTTERYPESTRKTHIMAQNSLAFVLNAMKRQIKISYVILSHFHVLISVF